MTDTSRNPSGLLMFYNKQLFKNKNKIVKLKIRQNKKKYVSFSFAAVFNRDNKN